MRIGNNRREWWLKKESGRTRQFSHMRHVRGWWMYEFQNEGICFLGKTDSTEPHVIAPLLYTDGVSRVTYVIDGRMYPLPSYWNVRADV